MLGEPNPTGGRDDTRPEEGSTRMIVCLCRGVSEARLQDIIDRGATTVREIAEACGAGRDCGACCPMVKELLSCAPAVR